MVLAHIILDVADSVEIFLHDVVEVVVGIEDALEIGVRLDGDDRERDSENWHDREKDESDGGLYGKRHDEGKDENKGSAHGDANEELKGVLHVGDVGGEAGHDTRRGELVDIGKGEVLHVIEHIFAQVCRKSRRRLGGVLARQIAEQKGKRGRDDEERARDEYDADVAGVDTLVDNVSHEKGNEDINDDLERDVERGGNGCALVLPDALCEFFKHSNEFSSAGKSFVSKYFKTIFFYCQPIFCP